MSPKKKIKKKNAKEEQESSPNQNSKKTSLSNINLSTYFTVEELQEFKTISKATTVIGVSPVIIATVLNKLDILKDFVKLGCPINTLGSTLYSPLMWAVKLKHLDIVDFLILKRADPNIRNENGDNVFTIAIEDKMWDEILFIKLWYSLYNTLDNFNNLDINFATKQGQTILHLVVNRDWDHFLSVLLLLENVNVDCDNFQGVTPLMKACYRNNLNIVTILLNAGASVAKEDNHGRMALCYAFCAAVKSGKPPFLVVEKIIQELKKCYSLREYFKTRLEMIVKMSEKMVVFFVSSAMMIGIFHFIVQFLPNGLKILLDLNAFQYIVKAIRKSGANCEKIIYYFSLTMELLFFNEQSETFTTELQAILIHKFLQNPLSNLCLERIQNENEDIKVATMAFFVISLACTCNEFGQNWLKQKYIQILPFYNSQIKNCNNIFQNDFGDEKRLKIAQYLALINTHQVRERC